MTLTNITNLLSHNLTEIFCLVYLSKNNVTGGKKICACKTFGMYGHVIHLFVLCVVICVFIYLIYYYYNHHHHVVLFIIFIIMRYNNNDIIIIIIYQYY